MSRTGRFALSARRRWRNRILMGLCGAAAATALLALALILWRLVLGGGAALSWDILRLTTPPPGSKGGLLNPILGSLAMSGAGIAAAAPLGVLAGTYLAEYGRHERLAHAIRFINDILLSAPSIIIGLFVYSLLVVPMGHFSGWAGALALALVAVPVIVRTTEDVMRLIPASLREAAVALGIPYWRFIVSVAWRSARVGILTGILLAVARISGETAPLLFTALNNQFLASGMNAPTASLPVVIFQFAMSPYADWQELAWAGALLISASVLLLNICARFLARRR
ncbi:MAG: phosphate ABC transporter permease PstA [Rhodospirillaceae bacterium]